MPFRLWVLVAGLTCHTWCIVSFQDTTARLILSVLCAFIVGVGLVIVADKFEHLEKEVAELREQVTQAEKSDELLAEKSRR